MRSTSRLVLSLAGLAVVTAIYLSWQLWWSPPPPAATEVADTDLSGGAQVDRTQGPDIRRRPVIADPVLVRVRVTRLDRPDTPPVPYRGVRVRVDGGVEQATDATTDRRGISEFQLQPGAYCLVVLDAKRSIEVVESRQTHEVLIEFGVRHNLEVRVVDSTQQIVPEATVEEWRDGQSWALGQTDAGGVISVAVHPEGYLQARKDMIGCSHRLCVDHYVASASRGLLVAQITLELRCSKLNLCGRVVDAHDRGIAGAVITARTPWAVLGLGNPPSGRTPVASRSTSSDERGYFDLEDVEIGTSFVFCTHREHFARVVHIPPLTRSVAGMEICMERGVSLYGVVSNPDGSPAVGCAVSAGANVHGAEISCRTDATGTFDIHGPALEVNVQRPSFLMADGTPAAPCEAHRRYTYLEAMDRSGGVACRQIEIPTGTVGRQRHDLTLRRPFRQSFRAEHGDGVPAPDLAICIKSNAWSYARGQPQRFSRWAQTDATGRAVLTGLQIGLYGNKVDVFLYSGSAAEAALGRIAAVAAHRVRLGGTELLVSAPPRGRGAITGVIVDDNGRPVPAFKIGFLRKESRRSLGWSSVTCGNHGRFWLHGLAAGTYDLKCFPVRGPGVPLGRRTVAEGAQVNLGTLEIPRAGRLRVSRTQTEASETLARLSVSSAAGVDGMALLVGGRSDPIPLIPGRYTVQIVGVPKRWEVQIEAGRDVTLELDHE